MALGSYCIECDAPEGECDHKGARYLDPITYQPGPHDGWIVPEGDEREEWERRANNQPPPQPRTVQQPKDVQRLIVELEAWILMDDELEISFRAYHEREPVRATRLVAHIIDAVQRKSLANPPAFLKSRLH